MTKHVILLTGEHKAPAPALAAALREAGISALVEDLGGAEITAATGLPENLDQRSGGNGGGAPLAIL